jgi:hypothetical protein
MWSHPWLKDYVTWRKHTAGEHTQKKETVPKLMFILCDWMLSYGFRMGISMLENNTGFQIAFQLCFSGYACWVLVHGRGEDVVGCMSLGSIRTYVGHARVRLINRLELEPRCRASLF